MKEIIYEDGNFTVFKVPTVYLKSIYLFVPKSIKNKEDYLKYFPYSDYENGKYVGKYQLEIPHISILANPSFDIMEASN